MNQKSTWIMNHLSRWQFFERNDIFYHVNRVFISFWDVQLDISARINQILASSTIVHRVTQNNNISNYCIRDKSLNIMHNYHEIVWNRWSRISNKLYLKTWTSKQHILKNYTKLSWSWKCWKTKNQRIRKQIKFSSTIKHKFACSID